MKKIFLLLVLLLPIGAFADTDVDAANRLADEGFIVRQATSTNYRLSDTVLRQEVIGTAVKLSKISLPSNYACREYYQDLTSISPNTWACRALELAADNSLISRANSHARPEVKITRAEALAIVVSTQDLPEGPSISVDSRANEWQTALLRRAYAAGVITDVNNFDPNSLATRGEFFRWADALQSPQVAQKEGIYDPYTSQDNLVSGERNILFFHAAWCPTCISADTKIRNSIIPDGVNIWKIDYDNSHVLRGLYGVTRQHTFIEVDSDGGFLRRVTGSTDVIDLLDDLDAIDIQKAVLIDVNEGVSTGSARTSFQGGEYILHADFENLPPLEEGYFYEGWVVRSSPFHFISTGELVIRDGVWVNTFVSDTNYTDHTEYVLTLEPNDGDPAPAAHILEGTLK